ncbi:MAG: hypothetical protein ACKO28_03925, partial [Cyanobium sp.]
MPGDRPRTTPLKPSRSPGLAAALPVLSLVLLGQGSALAEDRPLPVAPPPIPDQPPLVAQATPTEAPPGSAPGAAPFDVPTGSPAPSFTQPATPAPGAPGSAEPPGGADVPVPPDGRPVARPEPASNNEPRVLLSEVVIQGLD